MYRDHEDERVGGEEGRSRAAAPPAGETTARIRLLVVDDHPIVRAGIVATIEEQSDMEVVAQAGTGEEAIRMFRAHLPDVVLMDLSMPEMDGWTAVEAIRREHPRARIIVLTVYDGEEDIRRALDLGAVGYLLKDASRDKVVAAIRAAHVGLSEAPEKVLSRPGERATELSARELEVLQLISEGFTNREIGEILSISEGTVKTHVVSVLSKMSVRDRTHAVAEAIQRRMIRLG
ncbi:MAG: response regulator transcription factor [Acidobacteriota bacterium]